MSYLIRMAPEVEKWLADARDRDPAAADRIDKAVAALRAGGTSAGPPLVIPLDDPPPSVRPDLDGAYQRQLERQMRMRRAVADVATARKRLELQIGQLEQQVGKPGEQSRQATETGQGNLAEEAQAGPGAEGRLADLRHQYADMQTEEERLTVASQRLQAKVEAFRTRKESIKASLTAAQAAAEAAWAEAVIDEASADAQGAGSAAGHAVNAGPPGPAQPPFWLSELRPGALESADARILFTVEPSGTAVLLAAGTESDRLRAWYAEAIEQCRIRYQREQGNAR